MQIDQMLEDEEFSKALARHLKEYAAELKKSSKSTPFQFSHLSNQQDEETNLLDMSVQLVYLNHHAPEIFNSDPVFHVMNFALGSPGLRTSMLEGLGAGSLPNIRSNDTVTPQDTHPHHETRMSDAAAFILAMQMLQN